MKKNGVLIVLKKELMRFFGDKRLLFMSVIMPGLLIYLIYSLMGSSLDSMISEKTSSYKAAAVNMPQSIVSSLEERGFEIEKISTDRVDSCKEQIRQKELSVCVVFPDNFETVLSSYSAGVKSESVPNICIYYNSADINSAHAYANISVLLDSVEREISNVFDVNSETAPDAVYDVATKEDTTGTMLSMFLPMIIMTLLYSSCAALAPESIAGEKERGTIAALLITPVPRSQIILGKVAALSIMALLGGLSSFLGTFLSLPQLMKNMGDEAQLVSADVYKTADYLWLVLLILTTVLLLITLISILSTLASSVKEAGTLVMPLMLVVMLLSFMTMYNSDTKSSVLWYLIPLFNTIESMTQIFSFSIDPPALIVTACANIVYSAAGVFVLTKLFDSERVMFK